MPVTFTAAGSYIPPGRISNEDISARIEAAGGLRLPAHLIRHYTGIETRSLAAPGTNASDLAALAVRNLEAEYPDALTGVDLLIFASASRDMVEPATAHAVADLLGLTAHCFDLSNACNSLINGIEVAAAMLESGRASKVLLVSGEMPSHAVRYDPTDTKMLRESFAGYTFGDGAAALILEATAAPGLGRAFTQTHSTLWRLGGVFGGGTRHPRDWQHSYFTGEGAELKDAFEAIGTSLLEELFSATGLTMPDFAKVLVHQVTAPYTDRLAEVLGIGEEQLVRTVNLYGNLASATLGVQLHFVWDQLNSGDMVLLLGLGGGVSLQAMVWQVP